MISGCLNGHAVSFRKAQLDNIIEFADADDFGYVEEQINFTTWKVKYIGMEKTEYSHLEELLHMRASQLCNSKYKLEITSQTHSVAAHREPVNKRYVQGELRCQL
jgi:hypothetical protein